MQGPITVTVPPGESSGIIRMSPAGADIRIAIFLEASSATVSIEATPDKIDNSVSSESDVRWFPVSEDTTNWAISGNQTANVYFPVNAIRVLVDGGSSSDVVVTVIQAGPF